VHELVTLIAQYAIAIPVLAYFVLAYSERHKLKQLVLFTFLSAIIALVCIKVAAAVHSDPRPFIRDGVTPYFSSATDNGFPSDHTALSSMLAAIVFRYNKIAGTLLLLLTLVIGAARVIGGVHHGQDVIGAFVLALMAVYLAHIVTKLLWANKHKDAQTL